MSKFRADAEAAHREGFTFFDQLGSRLVDEGLELWLRLINPTTFEARVIKVHFLTRGVSVADLWAGVSVSDLWAGAKWAEAEIELDFHRAASRLTSSGESAQPGGS